MRSRIRAIVPCLAVVIVMLQVLPARGQSFWLDPDRGNSFSLELAKVDLEGNPDLTFTTAVWNLSGRFQMNNDFWFIFEMPFSHVDFSGDYPADNDFGNPFVGLRRTLSDSNTAIEFGVRPPIAQEDKVNANAYGVFSDLDRFGAFVPHILTLKVMADILHRFENTMFVRGRAGMSELIQTKDYGGDQTETLIHIGGQVGFQQEQYRAWAGVNTVTILTEDSFFGEDRMEFEVDFGANLRLGTFEPGIFARFPAITDLSDYVSSVYGLNCTFKIQ